MVSCRSSFAQEGNRSVEDSYCSIHTRKLALVHTRTSQLVSGLLKPKAIQVLMNRTGRL